MGVEGCLIWGVDIMRGVGEEEGVDGVLQVGGLSFVWLAGDRRVDG